MAVTPDNIQTLLAVQECVGFGSVRIRSRKEAGFRRFLRFACGGAEAARFVATNWEEFGPKTPVAQLALLALDGAALGRGTGLSKARRDEVLRHRDVLLYMAQEFNLKLNGLERASRTDTDRFYNELMKGGRAPALERLAWFWIGDGSAGIYEHAREQRSGKVCVCITFWQSYKSYIEALKRAVADLGLGTLCVSSVPESRLDDDGYSRRKAYQATLGSGAGCQKLAKALLAPLRKAGAGHFAKAKILGINRLDEQTVPADAAKHARIRGVSKSTTRVVEPDCVSAAHGGRHPAAAGAAAAQPCDHSGGEHHSMPCICSCNSEVHTTQEWQPRSERGESPGPGIRPLCAKSAPAGSGCL